MKLLFDLTRIQPIGNTKVHGGGKYGISVFLRFVQLYPKAVAVYYNDSKYIEPLVLQTIKDNNITIYKQSEVDVLDAVRKEGGWLYTPLLDFSFINELGINIICTVHGIRQLELPNDRYEAYYQSHPNMFRLKKAIKYLLNVDSINKVKQKWEKLTAPNVHFVTVSEHSKYALLSFLPDLDKDKIKVFYSPSTIREYPVGDRDVQTPIQGKYWMMASGGRWEKNAIRGIMAFDQLFSERPDLAGDVVITGVKCLSQIHIKVSNPNRFHCVGFVEEVELQLLYKNAYGLLYPSLNEGFGYPPLEAMHEGCPVMASATASIPEVCGDAVLYFNPYLVSEMKMRILQLEDARVHELYKSRGYLREKEISQKQEEALDGLCRHIMSLIPHDE